VDVTVVQQQDAVIGTVVHLNDAAVTVALLDEGDVTVVQQTVVAVAGDGDKTYLYFF